MTPDLKSLQGKRALITGGLGFIGSTLAHRLVELGVDVTLVDSLIPEYGGNLRNIDAIKDQVRVNISDIRDEHAMKYLVQGQDYLFNLAGQTSHVDSMNNPYTDLDINCRSQLSILEACRKNNPGVMTVFASTRQMYGVPRYLPVDERHPIQPVDVNGINKMAGECYHLVYARVYGIRSCALRLTNTYGPRMRIKDARQTFLGVWIRNILRDEPLKVFGDGMQIRDFNYVDDVVEALLVATLSPESSGNIYNLGADDHISLKDTAELMIEVHGRGTYEIVPFPADRKVIDIGDYYGDYRLIHSQLGWRPTTSLADGLQKTLDYYRVHYAEYV
ncbi:MAG: NAD-dependent epimerase/dehydratase family protein [Betaproteobacteria bacterium]|nr:NAD-dependent epimerase/dehydratase family protein [Chthoniobacterales bacterium]MBA3776283.1 NAD-dependent epimerase/dehydratase family protein [Betaproteobacteria bacterium]